MKKVCVVGLGYIGLPTALIAAEHGFEVIGYDIDRQKVDKINCIDTVVREPGIDDRLATTLADGSFRAQTTIEAADCFIIAVPTPFTPEKKADLTYVQRAAATIAQVLKKGDVVILESTVPVGTTINLARHVQELTGLTAGTDFFCAYCPERVLPGKIFHELVYNSRVIGGINPQSSEIARRFYAHFVRAQLAISDARTAEMVKLVENSARDVQIAFANEVSLMAHAAGIDPYEVIALANKHPRVNILQPRCGVGGHCIAVDPWFLIEQFPRESKLLKMARTINDQKPIWVSQQIKALVTRMKNKLGRSCRVLLLGATYKPDVDDLRESPALFIAQRSLDEKHMEVRLCDPYVGNDQIVMKKLPQLIDIESGIVWADLVVCLVAHTEFKQKSDLFIGKEVFDVSGLCYEQRFGYKEEQLFWPAESLEPTQMINDTLSNFE